MLSGKGQALLIMDTASIATSLIGMNSAVNKQAAMFNIAKKQHQIDSSILTQLLEVVRSAPPPGQGNQVDISV